eukprot:CAMPEP_0202969776 /NCGR_PEP_ID=MMETSP1396-20130829/15645_1 /ASSEMBLY_ACC=CAM_ASM_000872 /TAXON_ID= /ORGANISM="Pseudokeronopsis sp., Strain Brazil" /LENGTH=41 /DNA_ID= /DNA_START= /DNA_END= /DNA_ORIENTATION=
MTQVLAQQHHDYSDHYPHDISSSSVSNYNPHEDFKAQMVPV